MGFDRYCIVQDHDCHWYLIQSCERKEFHEILNRGNQTDFDLFDKLYGDCRIDGPHRLTFTDPIEE